MIGRPIIRLESVPSTQDVAFRLGELGAGEGITVVARHQTGGRGRGGRAWTTPPGEALLFSVLFRPNLPPDRLSPLSILLADAIAATIGARFGLQASIKWPNDVLVGGQKLSGILLQVRRGLAVAGIGINLFSSPEDLPPGATSLRNENASVIDVDALLRDVLDAIEDRYERLRKGDVDQVIQRVNDSLNLRNEIATLRNGDQTIEGRVLGIRGDGALLLDVEGDIRAIVSGELVRGPRRIAP